MYSNDKSSDTGEGICSLFASSFRNVFKPDRQVYHLYDQYADNSVLNCLSFTIENVLRRIDSIDVPKGDYC